MIHNSFIRRLLSCHALNFVASFCVVANSALSLSSTSDHRRRRYCIFSSREYVSTEFVHDCKTLSSIFQVWMLTYNVSFHSFTEPFRVMLRICCKHFVH